MLVKLVEDLVNIMVHTIRCRSRSELSFIWLACLLGKEV